MFESGIITENDLCNFSSGKKLKFSLYEVIFKLNKCSKKSRFIMSLISALLKAKRAKKLALKIPEEYNEEKIKLWQAKVEALFNFS